MPDWIPDNLTALVVFKPIRIVLLIIAAFVLRRVLHRLINRSVRRAVDRPLTSRNQMAQKLIDATRCRPNAVSSAWKRSAPWPAARSRS